ncbi:endonuclease VII domain-containing protein [Streptomyces sp. NPDC057424]|uniref:endonuclease VII domain-containing protein n=1 Tax=Streptomyces sp. NPDC057424 TaxID=3346127 RepID=UPI0036C18E6A
MSRSSDTRVAICTASGLGWRCSRPVKYISSALCGAHYQQANAGKLLTPAREIYNDPTCAASSDHPSAGEGFGKWQCPRPRQAREWCSGHYGQLRGTNRIGYLRPIRDYSQYRSDGARKRCVSCEEVKPVSGFYPFSKAADGLKRECIECNWVYNIKIRFNITAEQYERILASQGGGCAICEKDAALNPNGNRLAIDHLHSCCPKDKYTCGKCVRGLLCTSCNTMLGKYESLPVRFQDSAHLNAYLSDPPASKVLLEGA